MEGETEPGGEIAVDQDDPSAAVSRKRLMDGQTADDAVRPAPRARGGMASSYDIFNSDTDGTSNDEDASLVAREIPTAATDLATGVPWVLVSDSEADQEPESTREVQQQSRAGELSALKGPGYCCTKEDLAAVDAVSTLIACINKLASPTMHDLCPGAAPAGRNKSGCYGLVSAVTAEAKTEELKKLVAKLPDAFPQKATLDEVLLMRDAEFHSDNRDGTEKSIDEMIGRLLIDLPEKTTCNQLVMLAVYAIENITLPRFKFMNDHDGISKRCEHHAHAKRLKDAALSAKRAELDALVTAEARSEVEKEIEALAHDVALETNTVLVLEQKIDELKSVSIKGVNKLYASAIAAYPKGRRCVALWSFTQNDQRPPNSSKMKSEWFAPIETVIERIPRAHRLLAQRRKITSFKKFKPACNEWLRDPDAPMCVDTREHLSFLTDQQITTVAQWVPEMAAELADGELADGELADDESE